MTCLLCKGMDCPHGLFPLKVLETLIWTSAGIGFGHYLQFPVTCPTTSHSTCLSFYPGSVWARVVCVWLTVVSSFSPLSTVVHRMVLQTIHPSGTQYTFSHLTISAFVLFFVILRWFSRIFCLSLQDYEYKEIYHSHDHVTWYGKGIWEALRPPISWVWVEPGANYLDESNVIIGTI